MVHLPASPSDFGLPESMAVAEREAIAHEGLVETQGPQLSVAAADRDAEYAAAGVFVRLVDVFDHAADALQLALL